MAAAKNLADAPPHGEELVITRTLDAPRDLVWRVWTDPAHARQWMGPRDHPVVAIEQDARPGGEWRICLRSVETGEDMWQGGVFRDIVEGERVVYTMAWEGGEADMLVTVQFADAGPGKTRLDFRQQGLPSKDARDGHGAGWSSSFDRLDDLLVITKQPGGKIQWLYPDADPVILGSRLFNAPRDLVWECFTRAEHMAKWWGPRRYETRVIEYDVREGGKWRIAQVAKDQKEFVFFGEFRELRKPDLFVWTFGFADMPPGEEVHTFADLGGRTLLTTLSRFPDMASRDGVRATDMEGGAEETYDQLEELLKTL